MKLIILSGIFGILAFGTTTLFASRPEARLNVKVRVLEIEESAFSPNVIPPKESYLVVVYLVLENYDIALAGNEKERDLKGREIKVAHYGETTQSLNLGDELCIRVRPTDELRIFARYMLEDFGYVVPEESLADYKYVDSANSCTYYSEARFLVSR